MKSVNNKVLVRVNMEQKNYMKIGSIVLQTANKYATNYREKSPVVGQFVETNQFFREGDIALFHHNHFYHPSPYFLQDDLYSVPMNKTIFGTVDSHGEMTPVMGNMICKRIPVETYLPLPSDQQKTHINRYEIVNPGWTKYKAGDIIFTRPHSGYDIIYMWDTEKRVVTKVSEDMVCGIVKKSAKVHKI